MPHGADDLFPLFLAEAADRLDRLDELLCNGMLGRDSEEWKAARRELHTLKGASRMMGLVDFAEVCHLAEDACESEGVKGHECLLAAVQNVRGLLDTLRDGSEGGTVPAQHAASLAVEAPLDTRISAEVLDRVSDQAVRISFLSKGVGTMVEDLYAIARTAETGTSDPHPEQVLATLALRLRRVALKAGQACSRFDRLAEQQLGSLLSIQVQPVRPLLTTLGRHGVELAKSLGKTVEVQVVATQCRLDQRIMAALKEALLHLVRNAVDHGIEPESERRKAGKRTAGTIVLKAETLSERVRLTVSDDGRGVDSRAVLARAIEQGLVTEEAASTMADDAVRQLIFRPGFSTSEMATTISGRGVGLDSVEEAVRKVGGNVWIEEAPGQGLQVTLDLPVSRRGESILVVEAGRFKVGIPFHQIQGFSSFDSLKPDGRFDEAEEPETNRIDLNVQFGQCNEDSNVLIHIVSAGVSVDLVVGRVIGEEEVFLHPWPSFLPKEPGAEALALLADGTPIAVLDIQYFTNVSRDEIRYEAAADLQPQALRVLLVDDSRITREMFRRILSDAGFEVTSVASGEEAVAVLEDCDIDCLVTDIEMPGIDGLELTRRVRAMPRWEHLPVVVVSTRDQTADRLAGLDAGADAYLAKQNLMGDELIALVMRLGGQS